MAKRIGGYKKSDDIEWAECHRSTYGEAITAATRMGQDVYTWMNDAIAFHVYYCERYQLHQQYRADQDEATRTNSFTVDPNDPRYRPRSPRPELTLPTQGRGSAGTPPRPSR